MDQTTEQPIVQSDVQQTTTLTADRTEVTEAPQTNEAPVATTQTTEVDFKSLIPEAYKEEKSLQNFNKMDDFVKSYLHSQKLVGLDKIPVPNKHATEEDWKEVYKKLGSPETPDGYQYDLPAENNLNEESLKSFSEQAVKLGLLPNQANGIVKYYNDLMEQSQSDIQAKSESARLDAEEVLRKEFGPSFNNKLTGAKNLATATLGEEFLNTTLLQDGSKLGDNPTVVKAFASLAEKLSEDTIIKGDTPSYMTTSEVQKQIQSLTQQGSPYWEKAHPNHKQNVDEVFKLRQLISS